MSFLFVLSATHHSCPPGRSIVFFAGDFNYRVDLDYETAVDYLRTSQEGTVLQELLVYDQLRKEWAAGRTFEGFDEGPIGFPPTYKIVNGTASGFISS